MVQHELIKYFNSLPPVEQAVTVFLIGIIAAFFFKLVIKGWLESLAKKTKTTADDVIVAKTGGAIFWLLLLIGFRIALYYYGDTPVLIDRLVDSITTLIIIYIASCVVDIIIAEISIVYGKRISAEFDKEVLPIIRKGLKAIVFIIAGIIFLRIWDININPILTGLGIAGIVVGLALQSTLENVFGGISLITDKSIKIGNVIKLDSGEGGAVIDVGLRATKIKTWDNDELVVPNGLLAKSKFLNFDQPEPKSRCHVRVGIAYGSNIDKAKKTITSAIKKTANISKSDPVSVNLINFGDFSVDFDIYFFVKNYTDRYNAQVEARERIYKALRTARIEIPFPVRTIIQKQK